MARPWTEQEKEYYRSELIELYIDQNKTINEIGFILNIKPQTVYDRLIRLKIPTQRSKKIRVNNKRSDITTPTSYSDDLAEFFGIMLGDGNLSHFQLTITLGTKEDAYANYVSLLMGKLFGCDGTILYYSNGYKNVYLGSVALTQWFQSEGLVFNKVAAQVEAPKWIYAKDSYMERFLRGFFDTDGSIYKLKFGIQISFTNYSAPLLASLQQMLIALKYNVSATSSHRLYITKISDVERFFSEIVPQNQKHIERFEDFIARYKTLHR